MLGIDESKSYHYRIVGVDQPTDNLFAKHPEVNLKKEISSLNIGDNVKLVGKEEV